MYTRTMLRELMKRGKNIVKFIAYNGGVFTFFSAILYLVYRILDKANAFTSIKVDIIPILRIEHYFAFFTCFCALIIIFLFFKSKFFCFDIFLKQYANFFIPIFYLLQIIVWIKSVNVLLNLIYFMESLIIYLVGKYLVFKQQNYFMNRNTGAFSEQPVIGCENLTKSQNKALKKLIKIIDDRKPTDSINIALLAAWGRGKSSVTDTLIDILQKRNGSEYKYFILKINMLTMNKISNLVEYVGEYFYSLFKLYSVSVFGQQENINFLSTISNLLDESTGTNFLKYFLSPQNRKGFIDLECERRLFSKQVSKLLKNSGRKNIILIIDDADRSAIEEKMLQLLAEFSSINGILCIITLDDKNDIKFRPTFENNINSTNNIWSSDIYNEVDKYIHLRIRIEDENHIEYEESIRKMLIDEYLESAPEENTMWYIHCSNMNKVPSVFDSMGDYTTQISLKNLEMTYNQANLLSIIFFENFLYSNKSFGQYLEQLITNYFSNCEELQFDVLKMLTTDREKWDMQMTQSYFSWFGYKNFPDDTWDWINNLSNRATQCLTTICDFNNGVELLDEKKSKNQFEDLHSVYVAYMNTKFPIKDQQSDFKDRIFPNFNSDIRILINDNEQSKLLKLINNYNYPECRKIMRSKIEKCVNFYAMVILLNDFMCYLRKFLNNYRTFKIQLREAKTLNLNYIDYLLSEWPIRDEVTQQWNNMQKLWPILTEISFNWPNPRSFINTVIYNTYITGYGRKFKEIFQGRMWIYNRLENKCIVISKKNENQKDHIIMTITGKLLNIDDISQKEQEEIKEIGSKILGDF